MFMENNSSLINLLIFRFWRICKLVYFNDFNLFYYRGESLIDKCSFSNIVGSIVDIEFLRL